MAFTISQMVGETKADSGKELSARDLQNLCFEPGYPLSKGCRLMSTHVDRRPIRGRLWAVRRCLLISNIFTGFFFKYFNYYLL